MYNNNLECTVVDVGCRYGIHPTYRNLKAMKYYGIDFDSEEIARLKLKYRKKSNFNFYTYAISNNQRETTAFFLRHKGLSTLHKPNLDSFWFSQRKIQGEVISRKRLITITFDKFCDDNCIKTDFLKCDTEGHDYWVLLGAEKQFENIIGIRCEADFEQLYFGEKTFADIHSLLLEHKYFLLNFDYSGRGEPQSYFSGGERGYGIISGTDACYLKNFETILSDKANIYNNVVKASLFLMKNNASDVAIYLLNLSEKNNLKFPLKSSSLLSELEYEYLHQSYELRNYPGDNFDKAKVDYMRYFGKKYPEYHEFFQNEFINP